MNRHYRRVVLRVGIGTLLAVMGPVGALLATSDSWDGSTDGLWSTTTNWLADPAVVPGTGDIATFNSAGNGNTTIDLGAGVTIGTILFDTVNATAYTIGAGAVNSQTLTLDNGGAITVNGSVTNNQLFNAAIVLGNDGTAQSFTFTNNSTTGTLTFAGGITGSTGAGLKTLTLTGAGNTAISGAISNGTTGTVALIKSGAGTLTLSGAKTYSGGTTITAGVLSISAANNLGTGATLLDGGTLRSTGAANVDINTATAITVGASGGTINSLHTGGTFRFQQANSLLGSGALTITGNGTLALAGNHFSGIVVLNAANTYNGNVTLQDGGLLEVANAGGLATGATVTVGSNGGLSLAGVNFARAVTVNAGGTLLFQNNNNGVFSGPITLNGATTIRMQNWYNGTVISGTITSTITDAQTITVNSGTNAGTGGTLTLGGFDAKASSADIILNSASLAMNSNSGTAAPSVTRANSLTINTGNLNVAGVASQNTNDVFGTLNLGGGSTTTSTAGVLQGFSTWAFSPNAATNTAITFTNMGTRTAGSWVAISGAIGATPGAGTANIFFTNAPSGSNLIGAGGSLASGTASVIPWLRDQGGGNIYGYDATNGVAPVTTVGVDLNAATAGQNISDGGSTLTANRTINSLQATFGNYDLGGNTLTVTSGVITADNASFFNGTLDFGTAEGQLSVHQVRQLNLDLPITGTGGLTFVGFRTNSGNAGRLRLGGANTYTGVTNFFGYGAATADFYITNSLALQNTTVNYVAGRGSTLFFGNSGTSGQTAYTFGGLTGSANINLNNNNTTVGAIALTLGSAGSADTAATVNTYSGVLSNTVAGGSVIKDGVATQVLTGANTYSGGTTITNGDLRLGNTAGSATGTGEVFVSGGISATLSGTGIATGLTTVTGGSRLAPGNNTSGNFGIGGTLRAGTTGGLTLTDAHLDFDLQTTAASATDDLINTAALSLGSTIAFTFNGLGGSLETGAAYTLIGAGSISGFDENNISTAFLGALSGFYTAAYSVNGSNLQVTFSAIPEPGSAVSLLGGLGVLVGLQRFRRRQRADA